jgi:hypothetical protein
MSHSIISTRATTETVWVEMREGSFVYICHISEVPSSRLKKTKIILFSVPPQIYKCECNIKIYLGKWVLEGSHLLNSLLVWQFSFDETETLAKQHYQPTRGGLSASRWPPLPLDQPSYFASDVMSWGSLDKVPTSVLKVLNSHSKRSWWVCFTVTMKLWVFVVSKLREKTNCRYV